MTRFNATVFAGLALLSLSAPVASQPIGGWSPGWGRSSYGDRDDPREGKVSVSRFAIKDARAAQLGHGPVEVKRGFGDISDVGNQNVFEAALVEQLVASGYTVNAPAGAGQVAEMTLERRQVTPPEPPHKPVSGEATVGVGNHGSFGGLAVAIDLSKPRQGLVATRLLVRIREAKDQAVLWEGHAQLVTREGDRRWPTELIARKLASSLFKGFPEDK